MEEKRLSSATLENHAISTSTPPSSPDQPQEKKRSPADDATQLSHTVTTPASTTTTSQPPKAPQRVAPPPDGGYGWVCAVCVAFTNAHTWGLNSSYGVFLAYYLRNNVFPGATRLQYAFVGSLSIACAMAASPLATICVRRWGTKTAMCLGIVMETASLICASFASQIWHLFLTQGVLFGFGMGFLFVPTVAIVPQWFEKKRSLANGCSACGSGLGGLLYSFATGAMIKNLGVDWAFRILGILAFVVNTICMLLIKDRNKIIGAKNVALDVSLLRRVEYLLVLGFAWFSLLAYVVLIFSLANYANEIGLNSSQAALVSGMFNLGQGIGRPSVGFFSDRTGRINMACLISFVAGIFCFAIWTNAKSYGVLIFFAIVGGIVGGVFWTTVGPVTAEVVGLRINSSALSLLWLSIVLPSTFSEPIGLEIVRGTGSYLGTQLWAGFMYVGASSCLLILRGWKIGEKSELFRMTSDASFKPRGLEDEELATRAREEGRHSMLKEFWKIRRNDESGERFWRV